MKIECVNHACFKIELAGKIIYFDPYKIPEGAEKADLILSSHDHGDHHEENSVKIIEKADTIKICPASCKKIVSSGAKGLKPGDNIEEKGIKIKAVFSYTPNKQFHPKQNEWLGFIVSDGKTIIYHAGDTDLIPEMEEYTNFDYAIIPVGGTYTMDQKEAVEAVKIMKPKNVVPMHAWSDENMNNFVTMMEQQLPDIKVIKLGPGASFKS
jgi:L-ascorbate metabolism protein UlaG (beta-lactamase superfamily)